VITRDNVTIKVTAVLYFYVVDAVAAVVNVVNFNQATTQIGQTTLRNVLGQSELDELLAERKKINRDLQAIIDEQTERWGVKVTAVEIKDVELPATMQRAMAKQAEAEREKRAKVIHAQGELQASAQLAQAAAIIGSQPATLQLRYLQTLTEIAVEKNSTIIFPLPMDLIVPLIQKMQPHTSVPVSEPLNGTSLHEHAMKGEPR
jgi:regulator of protease activity HflC (stomatin/prohibitin superfamily)